MKDFPLFFKDEEYKSWHNPYDQELREQESIKNGDTEALKKCWSETYEGKIGTLAADPLRNVKNLAVGVITLSSRSAIKGGLNAESVFSMVDHAIFSIEQHINKPEEVIEAIHDVQMTLTELVKENKSKNVYNPVIKKIKDYVFMNIHEKIRVADIAKWLDMNPNYISGLFKRSENKTLINYIMEQKINACANMLKFSDYSIQRIGAYFGFYSQSHFTEHFKRIMGMTPGRYRTEYAVKNFQKIK